MARLDQGLLGGYSGKLGTTVGASWKGINVVRTYQPTVANPNTQKQRNQRDIFRDWAQLASFLLASHVKPLWDHKAKRMSGYNAFVRANINNPRRELPIDPVVMILTDGKMGTTQSLDAAIFSDDKITLAWEPDILPLYGSEDDKMYAIVFNYSGEVIGTLTEDITRKVGTATFDMQYSEGENEAIVVVGWESADKKLQSPTQHFEAVPLP